MTKKIFYIDIDETICETPSSRNYFLAIPIKSNIDKINALYDAGNTIVYWTSRGSRAKVDWYTLTKQQLDSWGVKYHELRVDKPYYDFLIDDKALTIEKL